MFKETAIGLDWSRHHPVWLADNTLNRNRVPDHLRGWLCADGSLTQALMEISDGSFEVELLSQQIQIPNYSEQLLLRLPLRRAALVRQVQLHIHGEPVVYARSIIPLTLAGRGGAGLASLGKTPLGHLLFKRGRMRVSRRELMLAQNRTARPCMAARRTPYDYLGSTILVSEYFLPSLAKYW